MAPTFFVSYAQGDIETPDYRATFVSFVTDLKHRVSIKIPHIDPGHTDFIDTDIRVGDVWSDRLGIEISQCRVGVVLMSPRYFTRRWCGQEFQVMLRRMAQGPGLTGIVPVPWEPLLGDPPQCVARIQSTAGAFPPEYFTRGMRRLSALRAVSPLAYEDAMDALTSAIASAAEPQRLTPLPLDFDLDSVPSAWEMAASAEPNSHTEGGISKTCFVFLSRAGRDWVPYDHPAEKINALAQTITGEMRLSYEELPCDATLPKRPLWALTRKCRRSWGRVDEVARRGPARQDRNVLLVQGRDGALHGAGQRGLPAG